MTGSDLLFLMSRRPPLHGWVDMHTHPMAHLAFSGKLIHGAPDVGSLIPTDVNCQNKVSARDINHALSADSSSHGGPVTEIAFGIPPFKVNPCGDLIRKEFIHGLQNANKAEITPDVARGYPDFAHWPHWNDITHQKMWIDWIRRAYEGGLRVMVALAVHNKTLADAVGGPGDGPRDDKSSADLQIAEMKSFVDRNSEFMAIAYTPQDLRRIVRSNKLAIVLGVEIDAIGNFHKFDNGRPTLQSLKSEIIRLHSNGVRYIFPIHVIDNVLGGAAIYQDAFNISNYREYGKFFQLQCSAPEDDITYKYTMSGFDLLVEVGQATIKVTKLGIDPFRKPSEPPGDDECKGQGHMNSRGLTKLGEDTIKEMMKLGLIIDIDHMSHKSAENTLKLAESVEGGYPLNSGHTGLRTPQRQKYDAENSRTASQLQRIANLGGMFGLGTAGITASSFTQDYQEVKKCASNLSVGLGTDTNGLEKGPRPGGAGAVQYQGAFQRSMTGIKQWDYNTDGVAHYGMFVDFLQHVKNLPNGSTVYDQLFQSAEGFARMWERCEVQKSKVR